MSVLPSAPFGEKEFTTGTTSLGSGPGGAASRNTAIPRDGLLKMQAAMKFIMTLKILELLHRLILLKIKLLMVALLLRIKAKDTLELIP